MLIGVRRVKIGEMQLSTFFITITMQDGLHRRNMYRALPVFFSTWECTVCPICQLHSSSEPRRYIPNLRNRHRAQALSHSPSYHLCVMALTELRYEPNWYHWGGGNSVGIALVYVPLALATICLVGAKYCVLYLSDGPGDKRDGGYINVPFSRFFFAALFS